MSQPAPLRHAAPPSAPRDHGGGLDAAIARHGGDRAGWLDLSTGINPVPYPIGPLPADAWTALPDAGAMSGLLAAARRLWAVPDHLGLVAAPGASALIARLPALWPDLAPGGRAHVPAPTYNEHAASLRAHGWEITEDRPDLRVIVHPNNPTGSWHGPEMLDAPRMIVDESFCDIAPSASLLPSLPEGDHLVLKSFGKFWGLAGLRLGFAIGPRPLTERLAELIGPWPVSGPGLAIATKALGDEAWAQSTRARLARDATRLDEMMQTAGAQPLGGTDLFRLYELPDAALWQEHLARHHIWSRAFPYAPRWLRLGLPAPGGWDRIAAALAEAPT